MRTERVAGNGMPAGRVVSADFTGPANSVVVLRISDGSTRRAPSASEQSGTNSTGGGAPGGNQAPPAPGIDIEQELENAAEELRNLFNF